MKKVILITTLILTTLFNTLKAHPEQGRFFEMHEHNTYRAYVAGAIASSMILWPLLDGFAYNDNFDNSNGMYLGVSCDPRMLITEGIDYRVKMYSRFGKVEPALIFENFPLMRYMGLSAGLDYVIIDRKLSLLAGIETTRIWNANPTKIQSIQSYGVNIELRLLTKGRANFSYIANFKTRPELSEAKPDVLMSGYIQFNYRIINCKRIKN